MYRKINSTTGLWEADVILDAIPMLDTWPQDAEGLPIEPTDASQPQFVPDPSYITTPVPQDSGFILPRWDGEKWVEGGTAPEPAPHEPTLEERTTALEAAMLEMILGGGV